MMPPESPSVIVVDDDPSVRSSVKRLLRSAGYEVQAFASTSEALSQLPPSPHCLILDVELHGENGLEFQQRLRDAGAAVPIIFITGHGDIPMSVRAMKAGAADFLPKPFDADELLGAVAKAVESDARASKQREVVSRLRGRYAELTSREREVFAAVCAGMLNKHVALELGISEKTVKVHRSRVMEKMGVAALADLVRMADLLGVRCDADTVQRGAAWADEADFPAGHDEHVALMEAAQAGSAHLREPASV